MHPFCELTVLFRATPGDVDLGFLHPKSNFNCFHCKMGWVLDILSFNNLCNIQRAIGHISLLTWKTSAESSNPWVRVKNADSHRASLLEIAARNDTRKQRGTPGSPLPYERCEHREAGSWNASSGKASRHYILGLHCHGPFWL